MKWLVASLTVGKDGHRFQMFFLLGDFATLTIQYDTRPS